MAVEGTQKASTERERCRLDKGNAPVADFVSRRQGVVADFVSRRHGEVGWWQGERANSRGARKNARQ